MSPPDPGPPVLVAFDGGLLASYLVASQARAGRRVVALTVDAGASGKDGEALARRARALGADEHVVADAAEHVWDRYVGWLVRGDVLLGGVYPPWVQAERYAEVDHLVLHARRLRAAAIAHPASGDDLVRLEGVLRAIAPDLALLEVPVAPLQARAWLEAEGLLAALGDAARVDLGGPQVRAGAWGSVAVGGDLEDPWSSPESEVYPTVPDAADAAALPEEFELEFTEGLPTSCCGAAQDGPTLVRAVARLARRHGVGRGVHLGEGPLGVVSRVAFEAPAATVIVRAHQELSRLVLTRRQLELQEALSRTYGDLFHRGLHHEPALRDIERFFESTQRVVTGTVRVRLQRGALAVVGVRSPAGLAGPEAWAAAAAIEARDARGYARIAALPGRLARCRDERSAREAREAREGSDETRDDETA